MWTDGWSHTSSVCGLDLEVGEWRLPELRSPGRCGSVVAASELPFLVGGGLDRTNKPALECLVRKLVELEVSGGTSML